MTLETLQTFLLYCLAINFALYLVSVVALLLMKGFILKVHERLFGFDAATTLAGFYRFLAHYKLLVIVFNVVPWLALRLMR